MTKHRLSLILVTYSRAGLTRAGRSYAVARVLCRQWHVLSALLCSGVAPVGRRRLRMTSDVAAAAAAAAADSNCSP